MKKNLIKSVMRNATISLVAGLVITASGLILEGQQANAATTGWQQNSTGKWIYVNNDGSLAKGWLQCNSDWYYLDKCSGEMYTGTCRISDTESATFRADGKWVSTEQVTNTKSVESNYKLPEGSHYYYDCMSKKQYEIDSEGNWTEIINLGESQSNNTHNPSNPTVEVSQSSCTNSNNNTNSDKISLEEFTKIADDEMLRLVNEHRAANGVEPLEWNDTLARMSTEKSEHMRKYNYMAHDYNGQMTCKLQSMKYHQYVSGENCLANYRYSLTKDNAIKMANSMFNQWKNSAGHNRQMINPDNTEMGFGFALSDGSTTYGSYATQQFDNGTDYYSHKMKLKSLIDGSRIDDDSPDYLKGLN